MKNLVIVESPAKAKTIEKYLGSDFKVLSSVGHIRSIAKKTKDGRPPIDIEHGFEVVYEIDPDKKKTVAELRKAIKAADNIWLATDEDREGEAIAWHLCEVLKLDTKSTKRIVFHEITKGAIEEAVKQPRIIDMDLVKAQQARQILDRIVGFELSPVLWQKVPGGKSAGRVQSPAVRLLVEREREIEAFESATSFRTTAEFQAESSALSAELNHRFDSETEAEAFLGLLPNSSFKVAAVTKNPASRNPSAPFTTSTLQQEANSRLGFSARTTMAAAQKLYQTGKITYMRTDSVVLSNQSLGQIASYIETNFGKNYHQVRKFKTKSSSAQEAHEAIRPTDVNIESAGATDYEKKLYSLIRNRTLASQMAPAKLEKTVIAVDILSANGQASEHQFEAKGEVVIFDGFLKVYGNRGEDQLLPDLKVGDSLSLVSANAKQAFSRPPARYTEGSLVKKLEELGIGRPSTYATIINTVQLRGYAAKGEGEGAERDVIVLELNDGQVNRVVVQEKTGSDRGKLVPTPIGEVVSDFLLDNFEPVVDYDFTAHVEEEFDQIAEGQMERNVMLNEFYGPFHELVKKSGSVKRSEAAKARPLGTDPKSGQPIYARFGRFGPMLQLGDPDDKDKKPQFAPMPAGKKIDTITLEEALQAFKLPRIVGQTSDGAEIKANVGRFGPYIQIGSLFVSIKGHDPHTIELPEALQLYEAKLQAEREKNIAEFDGGIKVLKGRFGPYVTDGKTNAKIPKDVDPTTVDKAKAIELLASAPKKKGRVPRGGRRRAAKK